MKSSLIVCYLLFFWVLANPLYALEQITNSGTISELDYQSLINLSEHLQQGGYIFYFRHAATDHNQRDIRPLDLDDCSKQRSLSALGVKQAEDIGSAFNLLRIPVEKVISSPFCRCKNTARIAFGKTETSNDLYFAIGLARKEKQIKGNILKQMLITPPAKGTNTIIVSHTANLQEAIGVWPKPEGVAYLFKTNTQGKSQIIGKIKPQEWKKLIQN